MTHVCMRYRMQGLAWVRQFFFFEGISLLKNRSPEPTDPSYKTHSGRADSCRVRHRPRQASGGGRNVAVAARIGWQSPLREPYGRPALRDTVDICRSHCVACARHSHGIQHGRRPTAQAARATTGRVTATGQPWRQNRRGSRGRSHRPTKEAWPVQSGRRQRVRAGGAPSARGCRHRRRLPSHARPTA